MCCFVSTPAGPTTQPMLTASHVQGKQVEQCTALTFCGTPIGQMMCRVMSSECTDAKHARHRVPFSECACNGTAQRQSSEFIEIQLRCSNWRMLPSASSQCTDSNTRSIQQVQGRDSTGDNGRSKAGSQSSMPDNTPPLGFSWSCFYPIFFWAFGFGLGFVLGLLLF